MPMVTCKKCHIQAHVTRLSPTEAKYKLEFTRCPDSNRPSTPSERFVDATYCPHMEASISEAAKRGEI